MASLTTRSATRLRQPTRDGTPGGSGAGVYGSPFSSVNLGLRRIRLNLHGVDNRQGGGLSEGPEFDATSARRVSSRPRRLTLSQRRRGWKPTLDNTITLWRRLRNRAPPTTAVAVGSWASGRNRHTSTMRKRVSFQTHSLARRACRGTNVHLPLDLLLQSRQQPVHSISPRIEMHTRCPATDSPAVPAAIS